MIKIIEKKNEPQNRIIEMQEMEPLQVAEIVDKRFPEYEGRFVLRSSYEYSLEVMDLSTPEPGHCWIDKPTLKVRLLGPNEKIMVEMYNEG